MGWWGTCLLAGCGRTGLFADGFEDFGADAAVVDDPADTPAPFEAAPSAPDSTPSTPPICHPSEEICNGIDDDCSGKVDDMPPVACPGGGFSYCVAGRWSACPSRCEVCVPGSERICFVSYCRYWGVETCAGDGQGFGPCTEHNPPASCDEIARKHKDSVELERCCIEHGYCCVDEQDLDGDGDRDEVLGRCDEVKCRP